MRCLLAFLFLAVSAVALSPATAQEAPGRDAVVIGHRGASAYAPENTLPAVDLAIDLAADVVEVDVQLSLDREIVVMHDTTLTRTTNVEEASSPHDPRRFHPHVAFYTAEEITSLDAGSWGRFEGSQYAGAPVPTLAQTLDLFIDHPDIGLLIEVKSPSEHPGIEPLLVAELEEYADQGHRNPHLVQSFDHESMRRFDRLQQQAGLDYEIGVLGSVATSSFADYATFADQINPSHDGLTAQYVQAAHDAGFTVHPYTVNNHCRMIELIDHVGVDGIITDHPDVLRRTLNPDDDLSDLPSC